MKNQKELLKEIFNKIELIKEFDLNTQVEILNKIKSKLNEISPFDDPVDYVKWVKSEDVIANNYNPNTVAPPEMKLLELSIKEDGYTQPIVTYFDKELNKEIVIDGFHRNRVGKESKEINKKLHNYLPVVSIEKDIKERMASTIRHNRARGTHGIIPMTKVIEEMYFRGWSDKRISEQLGMEKDEVLRLKQATGLGGLFKNNTYSKAWE